MNIPPNPSRGRPFPCALVVEPPASGRSVIAKLLKANGVSIIPCPVSSQIVSLARQHCPDVVLVDVEVSEIDAEQSVAMLEAMTTVLLICPRDIQATRLAALEASGALFVLVKPLTADGLLHAFNQGVAESRGQTTRRIAAAA